MGGRERVQHERLARCVDAERIAERGHHERLVQRDPERDTVGEAVRGQAGVVGEPVRGVAVQPAARILQRLRQVPVVQGRHRGDATGQQRVGQPVIEVEPGRAGRAGPSRLDTRPGQREPVGVDAEVGHQGDILGPAVVVISGDVAGLAVPDHAGLATERVPDGYAPAVLGYCALYLVGGCRDTPGEARREPREIMIAHQAIVKGSSRGRGIWSAPAAAGMPKLRWRRRSGVAAH